MKKTISRTRLEAMKKRVKELEDEMVTTLPLMRGSIGENGVKHKQAYLSFNLHSRTHLMYVGEKRLSSARKMTENYKRLWKIVNEMTVINMNLLKNDAIAPEPQKK